MSRAIVLGGAAEHDRTENAGDDSFLFRSENEGAGSTAFRSHGSRRGLTRRQRYLPRNFWL